MLSLPSIGTSLAGVTAYQLIDLKFLSLLGAVPLAAVIVTILPRYHHAIRRWNQAGSAKVQRRLRFNDAGASGSLSPDPDPYYLTAPVVGRRHANIEPSRNRPDRQTPAHARNRGLDRTEES